MISQGVPKLRGVKYTHTAVTRYLALARLSCLTCSVSNSLKKLGEGADVKVFKSVFAEMFWKDCVTRTDRNMMKRLDIVGDRVCVCVKTPH